MPTLSTCLWFDDQAEEAARLYVSLFPNSRLGDIARYPEGAPRPAGTVMTVSFTLDGAPFVALNGGPEFAFSPAISLVATCETQAEVDRLWEGLTAGGGEEGQCGWLTDRFGVSWQVVPRGLHALLGAADKAAAQRAMRAMLQQRKLDLPALQHAFDGVDP